MYGVKFFYERVEDVEGGLACVNVIEVPVSIHSTVLLLVGFVIFLVFLFLISWVR